MVIAAGNDEGAVGRSAACRSSARGEHQHIAGPSSSSPPRPPPLVDEEKEAFHSRRLHNFSFPPTSISWGNQRLLRCSKLPVADDPGSRQPSPPAAAAGRNHHRASASGKRPASSSSPSRDKSRTDDSSSSAAAAAAAAAAAVEAEAEAAAAARPWNLRTRRAACNAPSKDGRHRSEALVSRSPSRLATEKNGGKAAKAATPARKQPGGPAEKTERREFLLTLTKEEVEEDYLVLKGTKPPRRPKKRPRNVQRQLDFLFPGCGLSEITPDAYKIDE